MSAMSTVALRPLNTLPIRATVGGKVYESVDADFIARYAFMQIGGAALKAKIATSFVDALAAWTGGPGSDDELNEAKAKLIARGTESLASLYDIEGPVRQLPSPPVVAVSAAPAPVSTIAEAHKWVLTWETAATDDLIVTEVVTEPGAQPVAEATPFELALLARDAEALASTPVEAAIHTLTIPAGPASGSAVVEGERAAIRAYSVRNHGLPDGFVYAISSQSEMLEPFLDRNEEITATSLDEIAALDPSRVEVWYEHSAPLTQRVPVVLVLERFDVPLVLDAIDQWRAQKLAPPDGEMIFVVTAARVRLSRVVVR